LRGRQDGSDITELQRSALIEIKFPLEIPEGEFDEDTVRLYRLNGDEWTTEGINVVSRTHGLLVSSINELGRFAVLATPR
jgi:hypothetical protein